MHNDALRSPRWWLFQSNPNYYDLLGAMDAMMESAWAVTRFGKEMAPGDRVFLWETGPAGGIRGLATITGPLRPRPSVDPDAEFVLAPDKVPTGQEVPIDFNMTFPEGPGRRTLRVHPLLSQMSHMSQPRPTNHRVAPEQATALLELLDLVPKGIPAFVTRAHLVQAIRDIDAGIELPFGSAISYRVHFGLRSYPSKAVVGRAKELATGLAKLPNNFSGGLANTQAAGFLVKRGFYVEGASARPVASRGLLRRILRLLVRRPIPRGQLRLYRLLLDAYPDAAAVAHLRDRLGDGQPHVYGGLRSVLANRINGLWEAERPGLGLLVRSSADGQSEGAREALVRAIEALPELFDHLEAHDEAWLAEHGQAIEVHAPEEVQAFLAEEDGEGILEGGRVDFDAAFEQFLAQLPGVTLGGKRSSVRVRAANEHWIDLLPTENTGRIALPSDLVREWLEASDEGLFSEGMKSRRMRELVVSRGSEWANYHHGFDGKLKALVEAWLDFRSQRLQLPLGVTPVAARPTPDPLPAIHQTFSDALREAGLHFGPPSRHDAFTRAFLASVLTKRFVLLTGLSGSGKSQVALRFGDFLGPGRSCIVPVRPDWTSPESLLGFPDLLRKAPDSESVPWHTPPTLEFILRAQASDELHLLILDEMNLAHVERYFADVLSGIESDAPCIPALTRVGDQWMSRGGARMPLPKNLVIIGTVNVDETTYMFSPKVLDRANTLEFRVQTDDLPDDPSELRPPGPLPPASAAALAGLQAVLVDPSWSGDGESQPAIGPHLKALHAKLAVSGFEFGHRVYFEAHRFARIHRALGGGGVREALDLQVMQKVLPRLHGSRRRVEGVLLELARFAFFGRVVDAGDFAPQSPPKDTEPVLPQSFDKLQRMLRRLAANQFVSFSE